MFNNIYLVIEKSKIVPETNIYVVTNDKNLVNKCCICKINATNFNGLKTNLPNWMNYDKKSAIPNQPSSPTQYNNSGPILYKEKKLDILIDRIVSLLLLIL